MSDRLVSTGQVAHALRVSEATVKRWSDAGKLKCFRTPGGHRMFRLRDIVVHPDYQHDGPQPTHESPHIDGIVKALLVGDIAEVADLTSKWMKRDGVVTVAETVIIPTVKRVRELCLAGDSYHLHIAMNAVKEVLACQMAWLRAHGVRGRVLCVPRPGETSDVLARLASLVAAESGMGVHLLGPGLTAANVVGAVELLDIDCVVLASETEGTAKEQQVQYINKVANSVACVVCLGDQVAETHLPNGLFIARNLLDLQERLRSSLAHQDVGG